MFLHTLILDFLFSCSNHSKILLSIQVPGGFEYAMGIEIFHCFFVAYHASGVQDSAGKDPRIMMYLLISFKWLSVANYHQCLVSSVLIVYGRPFFFSLIWSDV